MDELYTHEIHLKQTNMKLKSDSNLVFDSVKKAVIHNRGLLEYYILQHREFVISLESLEVDLTAPEFVRNMMKAGLTAGVGPMASVAGGLAEVATEAMMTKGCKLALANNGGDISVKGELEINVGIYAGEDSVARNMGFKIKSIDMPLGICTSAGVLGHSISFGEADAAVVFSRSAFLADAAATAVANRVKKTDPEGTIQNALELAEDIDGILGCMVFIDDKIGATGRVPEIVELYEK